MPSKKSEAAREIQEHGHPEALTYKYDRNRRYEVAKDTQCASVHWKIGREADRFAEGETNRRLRAQADAIAFAVQIYEKRWGLLDWGICQMLISHMTIMVVVELRVEPL